MNVTEIFEIAGAIMLSLGGAGTLLYGLSGFLGNIFIEHKKVELDKLRSDYQLEIEKSKLKFLRYSESQFSIYNNIWVALCDLEKSADKLWATAISREVKGFARSLSKAKSEIRKGALIIEEGHYIQLMQLFNEFEQFQFGKIKLVELSKSQQATGNIDEQLVHNVVKDNGLIRERFTSLIEEVKNSLRTQIKDEN